MIYNIKYFGLLVESYALFKSNGVALILFFNMIKYFITTFRPCSSYILIWRTSYIPIRFLYNLRHFVTYPETEKQLPCATHVDSPIFYRTQKDK